MTILGIEEITYGVEDLVTCKKFFQDFGLKLLEEKNNEVMFETLNGVKIIVASNKNENLPKAFEDGSSLRQLVWGVKDKNELQKYEEKLKNLSSFKKNGNDLFCIDPNGLNLKIKISQKRQLENWQSEEYNTWSKKNRINKASTIYDKAIPIEIGHIVFFVEDVLICEKFYNENFNFVVSDRYPKRGSFMRCNQEGDHHNLFLLERPTKDKGLNHVAFKVRDIHEVFGGGMNMSRLGWQTQLGPGRHPISSAYFWYFKNPAGALIEYYTDEDYLTSEWQPREFEPGPTIFAEWAIDGGIDGNTRRQKGALGSDGKFITDKR